MNIVILFTRGMSLEKWLDSGMFFREKLIYEEYLRRNLFSKVYWITYGTEDKDISKKLYLAGDLSNNIVVCQMPRIFRLPKIGSYLYSIFLVFVQRNVFKNCQIIKSNQFDGCWGGVLAQYIYGCKNIVRTGFSLTSFLSLENRSNIRIFFFNIIERFVYRRSKKNIVSSIKDKDDLIEKLNIDPASIEVVFNFVDTNSFFPVLKKDKFFDRILYVGRLSSQKNLFNLIKTISELDIGLDIYGTGPNFEELREYASLLKADVNFFGVVRNDVLTDIYNQYEYFILPSFFEGMPKTLIEALASGCVCIATNVTGNNEVIIDGYNGYLANGCDSDSIKIAILRSMNNNNKFIKTNAIKTINLNFSLTSYVDKEERVFKSIMKFS